MEEAPPLTEFPWIQPSRFIRAMAEMNDLHLLLGGCSLQQGEKRLLNFWKCYRDVFPSHQLFEDVDSGRKSLARCLPLFLHGDEGVSYKKNGLLVLSFQSAFGHGTSKMSSTSIENYRAMGDGVPLNFLHTGFQTRMLICVCPKEFVHEFIMVCFHNNGYNGCSKFRICLEGISMQWYIHPLPFPLQELYQDDHRVWNAIFELVVKDFADCERDGVPLPGGEKISPIILGNKGDWSYLESWCKLGDCWVCGLVSVNCH